MKIAIVSKNTRTLDELRRFIEADMGHEVSILQGGVAAIGPLADQQRVDIVLLESSGTDEGEFEFLSQFNSRHPGVVLVLLSSDQSADALLNAMRAGVREVLPSPVGREALQTAMTRIAEKIGKQGAPEAPKKRGKILAFISCKGGSGSTFLATNFAYSLALAEPQKKVLLIDLSLQFGDASLFISDKKGPCTLSDISQQINRVDASFLAASLLQVLPNLGVLTAPEDPVQAMEVKPEHVDILLKLAAHEYDYIILDVGRTLDPVCVKALDHAEVIFPVIQLTLPFIRDAKRLMDIFRSLGYSREKVQLLVNRYEKGGEIRLEDIERTLGVSMFKTIPNSFRAVATSVNQGIPIAKLSKTNPVTRALDELVAAVTQASASATTESSWWSNLLPRK